MNEDGSHTLLFRADGLGEIARWLLGWALVVRTPDVRAMVVENIRGG